MTNERENEFIYAAFLGKIEVKNKCLICKNYKVTIISLEPFKMAITKNNVRNR